MQVPFDNEKYKAKKWLTYATAFDGLGYMGFSIFCYGLKIGYVWHDAGPILSSPTHMNGYLNMILVTYGVFGWHLLKASLDDVENHKSLLSANAWALQFAHNLAMCGNMLFVRSPHGQAPSAQPARCGQMHSLPLHLRALPRRVALLRPSSQMDYEGRDEYKIMGVPANFWPFGDVPFLFLLWAINVYLMKKVFGTIW